MTWNEIKRILAIKEQSEVSLNTVNALLQSYKEVVNTNSGFGEEYLPVREFYATVMRAYEKLSADLAIVAGPQQKTAA